MNRHTSQPLLQATHCPSYSITHNLRWQSRWRLSVSCLEILSGPCKEAYIACSTVPPAFREMKPGLNDARLVQTPSFTTPSQAALSAPLSTAQGPRVSFHSLSLNYVICRFCFSNVISEPRFCLSSLRLNGLAFSES